MLINDSEFTRFGREWFAGKYDKLSKKSLEYKQIWQEQYDRCLYGYSVGGKFMTGRLYFYVNFGTIILKDEATNRKTEGRPLLRDVEWEVFGHMARARELKKNFLWISGRRGGKSFIGAGEIAYDYTFFNVSNTGVGAGEARFANATLKMVQDHLNGLNKTEFYYPRLKDNGVKDVYINSGWKERDREGKGWIDVHNKKLIYNINYHDNHTAANGKQFSFYLMEEIGMFDNLLQSYSSSEPCWKEGGENFGMCMLIGTGGDMEKGSIDAAEMFFDPETYDLLTFKDDDSKVKKAYFLPAPFVLNDHKDKEGNTNLITATESITAKREQLKKGKKMDRLLKYIQYYPFTPEEAFLQSTGNILPTQLIQEQIQRIQKSELLSNWGVKVNLIWSGGEVVHRLPNHEEILSEVSYPAKKADDLSGCTVLYEFPEKIAGKIPYGLYIAGHDPYAQDESETSPSLGSLFIYKRFYAGDKTYDWPVAEYTGRPLTADEYNENARKLIEFFNATCLYENMVVGFKQFMEQKNALHRLATTPNIVRDIHPDSAVNRQYGIHMTEKIKLYLLERIKNYLLTEYAPGHYNVEKIYSIPLLKEMLNYNSKGNFDRIIAFGLCLIYDVELHNLKVEEHSSFEEAEGFFDPLFELARQGYGN